MNAQHPQNLFYPNDCVRFQPPPGAYSPDSPQSRAVGLTGKVCRPWGNDYAVVHIPGLRPLLYPTAYLRRLS